MSSPPSLETLPAELHAMILRSLIGPKSLSSAIEASPTLQAVYDAALDKDELWTQVTINQLLNRGVKLFPPAPVVEICGFTFQTHEYTHIINKALTTLYSLFRQGKPLKLGLADCKALGKIGNMVKWNVIEDLTKDEGGSNLTVEMLNGPHEKFTTCRPYWHCESRGGLLEPWQYCFTGQSFSMEERFQISSLTQQAWLRERDEALAREEKRRAEKREARRVLKKAERDARK